MKRENFVVRTSERTKFTKCRQAWWWSYVDQMQPNRRKHYFTFGDLIHRSFAEWYVPETMKKRRRGVRPVDTFVKLYSTLEASGQDFGFKVDSEDDAWADAKLLGIEMLENYYDLYGKDEHILVVYPEMPFRMRIHDADGRFVGWYTGVADAFVYDLNRKHYGLMEHKTAAAISTDHLVLDEQAGTYWDILPEWLKMEKVIEPDTHFEFMLYNFMRKAFKDTRPRNAEGHYLNSPSVEALRAECDRLGLAYAKSLKKDDLVTLLEQSGTDPLQLGEVSKSQPADLFKRMIVKRGEAERQNTRRRIVMQMDEMFKAHNNELDIYKSPSKDCVFCEFRDVCEVDEQGGDWWELMELTFKPWNPYEQHIASMEIKP